MDVYKDFLVVLRTAELDVVHLQIHQSISTFLKSIVKALCQVEYRDGSHHTYYGDVMKNVNIFLNCSTDKMDEIIKMSDIYCNDSVKDNFLNVIEMAIDTEKNNHIYFCNEFLPVSSSEKRQVYEGLCSKHNAQLNAFVVLKGQVEKLDKPHHILERVKSEMKITLERTSEIFKTVNEFIASYCITLLPKLRASLQEIVTNVRNNIRRVEAESSQEYKDILYYLYSKNKEQLQLTRKARISSLKIAENVKQINALKYDLENYTKENVINKLQSELDYWEARSKDLDTTAAFVAKIRKELDDVEEIARQYKTNCSKNWCWKVSGDNIRKRKELLEKSVKDSAKIIMTHFAVKGPNHKIYVDAIGKFYIDEFNHRVYLFNDGLNECRVNCEGNILIKDNRRIHHIDDLGRYINKDGEKIYQRDPCASTYKLADNDLLVKIPDKEDCEHSDAGDKVCKINMKDPRHDVILPPSGEINTDSTLKPEVVKYLWDAFGALLPSALCDVATLQPKNPIPYLAHRLVGHKYGRTAEEINIKHSEAQEYRANVFTKRREKAIAESLAWRAKQFRRPKPEDFDDSQEKYHAAQVDAQAQAIDMCYQQM